MYLSLLIPSYPTKLSLLEIPAIRLFMIGSNAMSTCPFTGERCSLVAFAVDGEVAPHSHLMELVIEIC